MVFLYTVLLFISNSGLTFSGNETFYLNETAINDIMKSKIPVNTSQLRESKAMNYLYGDPEINDSEEQIDFSVFEPDEIKLLYETAQSKGEMIEREFNNSRRWYYTHGFIPGPYYITKTMDFMRHSVYSTRYRLKDTKHLRLHFSDKLGYRLAILYGSLMQLRIKMDNIYSTLYKFKKEVKFLWHIILYERCLATTIDANDIVNRMFDMAQEFQNSHLNKEGGNGTATTP